MISLSSFSFFVLVVTNFGGTLDQETSDFVKICLGCNVFEAYHAEEAAGVISETINGDYTTTHSGPPLPWFVISLSFLHDLENCG